MDNNSISNFHKNENITPICLNSKNKIDGIRVDSSNLYFII